MSNHFGVSVSDFISSEQETDGQYSYQMSLKAGSAGHQIKVKNYNLEATYTEQWQRSSGVDTYVLLAVPDNEIAE